MRSTILIGFDGSEQSFDALLLGKAIGSALERRLTVACVVPWHAFGADLSEADRQALRRRAEHKFAIARALIGTTPEATFVAEPWHSVAGELYALAERYAASMIVIGSTHRGPIARVMAGTVAERLLQGSPCPVVVAPRGFDVRRAELRTIGVGFDGSDDARAALELAGDVARATSGVLRVFSVAEREPPHWLSVAYPPARLMPELRAELEREQRDATATLALPIPAETAMLTGDPATELAARSSELDLLVVGSRSYGPLHRVVAGSVSGALVRGARSPVMVVPRAARRLAERPHAAGAGANA
jgi:nucleotide-binding universal stress UspA family protein